MQAFSPVRDQRPPQEPTKASVQLQQVTAAYEGVTALADVTFALAPGDQVAVVGPNGAGKSTLFNLIAGVRKPARGTVTINGSGPQGDRGVGYVPQRNRVDWRFPATVYDVVMMGRVGTIGLLRWPRQPDRDQVAQALERVGMAALAKRQIGELSGGQQQRVFLARALAQEAKLLLLDEPLTGLDLPSQETILELLAQLRQQGVTVLVATHDLNQAAAHFAQVLLLNRRLIALGSPQTVLTPALLSQAYGNHLHIVHRNEGDLLVADSCCDGVPLTAERAVDPVLAAMTTERSWS
ncbi:MAG: metal ABC transporter ATP-binding protein [Caldilineaceae bacterium]|nr:metal ABC transporter ATP-binding protein [Caldilineaceae bacterium]